MILPVSGGNTLKPHYPPQALGSRPQVLRGLPRVPVSPPRTGWKPARTPVVPEAHAFPSSRSISILQRQCLDRRIATTELLKQEVAAWESQRNQSKIGAN